MSKSVPGYTGRILRVDLSHQTISIETPDPDFYRTYWGGRNIAAYYLLKELAPGVDPLSPENILVFATSMLTGSPVPGSSRYSVAAKSPLTGLYGESEAGGWWGPELRWAGFDAIIVKGKAEKPTYLWIHDGEVEFKDATGLWGKEPAVVQDSIRKKLGDERIRVLQIGIAGENLVKYAGICNELKHYSGRTGLGAVMGSKNLKAIAVRGTGKITYHNEQVLKDKAKWFAENFMKHPGLNPHHELGTAKGVNPINAMGLLPTCNFREGAIEGAYNLSGENIRDTKLVGRKSCYACPVRCKRVVADDAPFKVDPAYGGPEYETIGALGSNCGVTDLNAVLKGNELCNKYGLDTISTGVTIAFAMECFEKGLLTLEDTDGIELRFGNGPAMVEMINKIAHREGLGDLLAEGCLAAARKIGGGSEAFAMQVKGMEFPSHEPRGKWGVALGYAVSPTGADHLQAAHDTWFEVEADPYGRFELMNIREMEPYGITKPIPAQSLGEEKVRLFRYLQPLWSIYNILNMCIFVGTPEWRMFTVEDLLDCVSAATGWRTSLLELTNVGERGIQLARCFNIREGMKPEADCLPERMFEPLEGGVLKGVAIDRDEFEAGKKLYYEMMDWDLITGAPSRARLAELGISWAFEMMKEDQDG
jgi:aldehyde:ferredoxin oxidoreductase